MTPIYDLGTRYFNSPKRRYIFPRTFIAIARKTKLLIYYSLISMTKKKEKKNSKRKRCPPVSDILLLLVGYVAICCITMESGITLLVLALC